MLCFIACYYLLLSNLVDSRMNYCVIKLIFCFNGKILCKLSLAISDRGQGSDYYIYSLLLVPCINNGQRTSPLTMVNRLVH